MLHCKQHKVFNVLFRSETSHVQDPKICLKSKGFKLETCCCVGYCCDVSAMLLRCYTYSQCCCVLVDVLVFVLLLLFALILPKKITCYCVGT